MFDRPAAPTHAAHAFAANRPAIARQPQHCALAPNDPLHGLIMGTLVLTLDGALPVQFLAEGERVITRNGVKILRNISVYSLQSTEMIRISAAALRPDCPQRDVFIAPSQEILLPLLRPLAMRAAADCVDGFGIRREMVRDLRLYRLTFDAPEIIYADGIGLGCP